MVFRVEAHKLADGGNRIVTVFEIFDGNVYSYRIQKADGRLPKLLSEQMVKR